MIRRSSRITTASKALQCLLLPRLGRSRTSSLAGASAASVRSSSSSSRATTSSSSSSSSAFQPRRRTYYRHSQQSSSLVASPPWCLSDKQQRPWHPQRTPSGICFSTDTTKEKDRNTATVTPLSEQEFAAGCQFLHKIANWETTKEDTTLQQFQEYITDHPDLVNFRDYDRRTPLHIACSEGHLELVQVLVDHGQAIINRSDRWGGSPLDDAERYQRQCEDSQMLLHKDAFANNQIIQYLKSKGGRFGSTSLVKNILAATWENDMEELQSLLDCKNSMNMEDTPICDNYDRRGPAHIAAYEGHIEILRVLLDHGCDVNAKDRWGTTPLDSAIVGNQTECVEILQQEYGGVRGTNNTASSYGREAILDLMHTYGKDRGTGVGLTLDRFDIKEMLIGIGAITAVNDDDRDSDDEVDDVIKKLMKVCDEDNNGLIDVQEFLTHHETFLGGRPARIILVVGGPGSGKGLLCERLTKECDVVHLSSGEMLRDEVTQGTELGKHVDDIMKSGGLVSSAIMVTLMQKRMKDHPGKRILLDGFPRSQENARDLVTLCGKPELALHITCDDTILLERVMKRGESGERADDNFGTAIQRVRSYKKYNEMTLDFLRDAHVPIVYLDGSQTPDGVWAQLRSIGRLMRSSVKF